MKYIIKDDDISVLGLTVRSSNALRRAGIHTVGDLIDYPTEKLADIRNMGAKSVAEIADIVHQIQNAEGELVLAESRAFGDGNIEKSSLPVIRYDESFIHMDSSGAIIQDISIENLGFNNRALNRFKIAGINFASQLLGMTKEELLEMPNMGVGTVEHAFEIISNLKVNYIVGEDDKSNGISFSQELSEQLFKSFGESKGFWLKAILLTKEATELQGESFIYYLYLLENVRSKVKNVILDIIETHNDQITIIALEEKMPAHLFNTTIIKDILIELESDDLIVLDDEFVYRKYPSIIDFANAIADEKRKTILLERLNGKTLDDIGNILGLTKERVRQHLQKSLEKRPKLAEDKYAYIFNHYDFTLDDFVLAFNEPESTYHYLCEVCLTERQLFALNGCYKKHVEHLLEDESVSVKIRKQVEKTVYKNYILAEGRRIKINRAELVKFFVRKFCTDLIKYDEFSDLYHIWLDDFGLSENEKLRLDSRTYENYLGESNYTLWHHGRSFRYYDIESRDFTELLEAIDFSVYNNMEISALKLFRDYSDLMKEYDIRDEYELHNLLKKIYPKEATNIKFGRMPNIEIGQVDREQQVMNLLLQYSPITSEELSAKYEESYGIKSATLLANYMASFDKYYFDGVYTIAFDELPENEFTKLKSILTEDFYTVDYIKRIYSREFPNSDIANINPFILKTLGFRVFTGYVINNRYSSATEFYNHLLTDDDIVDTRKFSNFMRSNISYTSVLYELKAKREIIEFAPYQYINIRRLNEIGITKNDLVDYCDAVRNVVDTSEFFTVKSLRNHGFSHKLDDLGFDDWFYASLLCEDKSDFSYMRISNTKLFCCGIKQANVEDLLLSVMTEQNKIDMYDLNQWLEEKYGMIFERYKLLQYIEKAGLYYDTIMETVYIDYDTYFEEI